MSEWIEFKQVFDDEIHTYSVRACLIETFREGNSNTTILAVAHGDSIVNVAVAEPYDQVKAKVLAAETIKQIN